MKSSVIEGTNHNEAPGRITANIVKAAGIRGDAAPLLRSGFLTSAVSVSMLLCRD